MARYLLSFLCLSLLAGLPCAVRRGCPLGLLAPVTDGGCSAEPGHNGPHSWEVSFESHPLASSTPAEALAWLRGAL